MQTRIDDGNPRLLIAGAMLVIAVLFGGGGSPAPMSELIVEITALIALVAWVWLAPRDRDYPAAARDWPLLTIAGLIVAIPVVQLIPLPPSIWHSLPGRDVEQASLALAGANDTWMPISVSPLRTLASALSLLPPMAMLFFTSRLTTRDRSKLLLVLSALGLLSVLVGVIQLAGGRASWLRFYSVGNNGFAIGFQAYRNAEADLLIIASMALAVWAAGSRRTGQSSQTRILTMILMAVMWLAVVVTGSRSGVAMIALAVAVAVAVRVNGWRRPRRMHVGIAAAIFAMVAVVGAGLAGNARVQRTVSRFDSLQDVRPQIWADTWYAVRQNWPVGSGVGTFRPVFTAAERLEYVRPSYANRAHNDYLEYMLEAGMAGLAIMLGSAAFAIVRIVGIIKSARSRRARGHAILAAGSIAGIVLHSLIDYPMRSLSLAVVVGMVSGLLWRLRRGGEE